MSTLILRPASESDKWDIFEWRNAENVRNAMLTNHMIARKEHSNWWDRKMDDPSFKILLFEQDGVAQAVQIFFDIKENETAWWAFYFTPNAPQDMGPMLNFWKSTELSGLAYAFERLSLQRLYCEVLRSNPSVLNWHKRFGFSPCDQTISENSGHYDLEVMDCKLSYFTEMREKKWAKDLENFSIAV